jgi:hypothetical protein
MRSALYKGRHAECGSAREITPHRQRGVVLQLQEQPLNRNLPVSLSGHEMRRSVRRALFCEILSEIFKVLASVVVVPASRDLMYLKPWLFI